MPCFLRKVAQGGIAVAVVDDHVVGAQLNAPDHGDRQVPKAGRIVLRTPSREPKTLEVVGPGCLASKRACPAARRPCS